MDGSAREEKEHQKVEKLLPQWSPKKFPFTAFTLKYH